MFGFFGIQSCDEFRSAAGEQSSIADPLLRIS
jgi:hypothetical protein